MLVSVDDLRNYMNAHELVDAREGIVMGNLLARVQKAVETYINRPVEKVQVREFRRSDSKGYLYLSVTPVWKVISCGGTTAISAPDNTETPYVQVLDPDLPADARIIDKAPTEVVNNRLPGGLKVNPCTNYMVEYIGGLDGINNDDIKHVIIAIAARIWAEQNIDAAGLSEGNPDSVSQGDTRAMWLTQDEKESLNRYKRRVIR